MKTKHYWGIVALWAALSTAIAADLDTQLRELAPTGVTLSEIHEQDGVVRLAGEASGSDKVSALMRAIDRSELGAPELIKMQRHANHSTFVLRIRR